MMFKVALAAVTIYGAVAFNFLPPLPAIPAIPAIPSIPAIPGIPAIPPFNSPASQPKPNPGPAPPAPCPDGPWAFDKYKLLMSEMPAETCIGKMIRPGYEGVLAEQYSVWVQDPKTKRLRFDMGHEGEEEFTQLYLFANYSYVVVTPGNKVENKVCVRQDSVNFEMVLGAYIYPYVRYLSDGVWKGKPVRFYAGVSPDPFTKTDISNVAIMGYNKEYYGMAALSKTGYIYYDYNVTMGTPDEKWFKLPSICNA